MRRLTPLALAFCLLLLACGGGTPAAQPAPGTAVPAGGVAAVASPSPTATATATPRPTATATPKSPTPTATRPRTATPTLTATAAAPPSPTAPPARVAVAETVRDREARCSTGLPAGFAAAPGEANVWRSVDRLIAVRLGGPVVETVSLDAATVAGLADLGATLADFRETGRVDTGSARRIAFTGTVEGKASWGTYAIGQFGLDLCQVAVIATVGTTVRLDPLVETVAGTLAAIKPRPAPLGYLALGDSYAAGVGAADPATGGYAARFGATLRGPDGAPLGLKNLAISGSTSADWLGDWPTAGATGKSPLAGAVQVLGAGEIRVVTLDIGGNDILRLLQPGQPCAGQAIEADACLTAMRASLRTMSAPSLPAIIGALVEASAPGTQILVLTYPNPFSTGGRTPIEARVAIGLGELNGLIGETVRALAPGAAARQVTLTLVDLAPPFANEGGRLTHILATPPDIHPNDDGHALIAVQLGKAYKR